MRSPKALIWMAEISEALEPCVNGAYVNMPNLDIVDWTPRPGANCPRLSQIKAKYDPLNLFRYQQRSPLRS